jgi:hypothetical protein
MTLDERFQAAHAITDPTTRKIEFAIVEAEWDIQNINKRLETARKRVEDAAARPSAAMYADSIEGWLHDWRSEYTQLLQKTQALALLNHLARSAEPEDAHS